MMHIKVLVEKSFKQSSSLPHSSADTHSLLNTAQLCSAREIEMMDASESAEKRCLFRAQLQQTTTGKAVSCVDIGNIVNNSRL